MTLLQNFKFEFGKTPRRATGVASLVERLPSVPPRQCLHLPIEAGISKVQSRPHQLCSKFEANWGSYDSIIKGGRETVFVLRA